MLNLSQNKKIAISAISLFLISFTSMLFFLKNNGDDLSDGQANVAGSNGHQTEQTEQAEVADKETVYRGYLGNEENPIFVVNTEGTIVFASDNCCELLSVVCDQFVGKLFFDYINTKDLSALVAEHTKLIQDPKLTENIGPYRMIKSDKEILVLFDAYPILDDNKKVTEIIFAVKDITEQAEELNDPSSSPSESENEQKTWFDDLYPQIQNMKDQQEIRMMVDKISYKSP